MTGPLTDALLAEQARRQAALERMLRTVARWAGLPDGAGEDDGAEHRMTSDTQAPAPVTPVRQETGLQVGPPRSSETTPPPAGPRTAGSSAQVSERGAITPARPAGPQSAEGWQHGLPPARLVPTASSPADRYRVTNSSNAERSRSVPQLPPAGHGPVGQEKRVEAPPRRARLRALANGLAEPRTGASSPRPLRETTALRRARLTPPQPYAAGRAPSVVPNPHPGMTRSDERAGPSAPQRRDTPDQSVAWGRTDQAPAMTTAPLPAPVPSPPADAVVWPQPVPHRTPDAAQPVPAHAHRPDPFPESTFEEAIADALERAALEAGIDLT